MAVAISLASTAVTWAFQDMSDHVTAQAQDQRPSGSIICSSVLDSHLFLLTPCTPFFTKPIHSGTFAPAAALPQFYPPLISIQSPPF